MTVLASDIITRAQTIVQDTTGVRWPTAELLHWLNDGQREVANVKPSATAFNTVVNLQQGTLQQIGAGNLSLLRVIRNLKPQSPHLVLALAPCEWSAWMSWMRRTPAGTIPPSSPTPKK